MASMRLPWLLVLLSVPRARPELCHRDQLDRCRTAVRETVENGGGYQSDTREYCRNLYRKLHCLVTQTSLCLSLEERRAATSTVRQTWRFLRSVCDGYAVWWRLDCYRRDDVKHCESSLTDSRNVDGESCGSYRRFRECATLVVGRCSSQDQSLLGLYLLDKGRDRAWMCSGNDSDDGHSSDYQRDPDCGDRLQGRAGKCKQRAEEKWTAGDGHRDRRCCVTGWFRECLTDWSRSYCGAEEPETAHFLEREYFGPESENCSREVRCSRADGMEAPRLLLPLLLSALSLRLS